MARTQERDNQQANLKEPSAFIALHPTAHARALVYGERRRLFPFVPTAIGRVLVRVRVRPLDLHVTP